MTELTGPIIVAKCEMEDGFATKLMGPGWHPGKSRLWGTPNPDLIIDYGWISKAEVYANALKAEVDIYWI